MDDFDEDGPWPPDMEGGILRNRLAQLSGNSGTRFHQAHRCRYAYCGLSLRQVCSK